METKRESKSKNCNELSDYDILGLHTGATYNEVKSNYHLLSRYYHPDSHYKIPGVINLSKEEKEIAYQQITNAYQSLKKKLKQLIYSHSNAFIFQAYI